jgi:hypothetical protein
MSSKPPNLIDRVVLSSDANPKFIQFWPIVTWAWQRLFQVPVHLALVASHDECDFRSLALHGHVRVLPPVPGIPTGNQAKIARYFLAASLAAEAQGKDSVTLLNDMDLLPINKAYFEGLLRARVPGSLLTVGSELYTGPEAGKFTAGCLTAEDTVWHRLVNPNRLSWRNFVESFAGTTVFDAKENILSKIHHEHPDTFSDESLLRAWLHKNPVPVTHQPRGFYPYTAGALCRTDWRFDPAKIMDGTIKEAHLLRPYSEHREQIDELIKFLKALVQ